MSFNLQQRLRDLAWKIDNAVDGLRARIVTLENASSSPSGPTITVGPTAPSNPDLYDLWVDTN